MVTSKVHRKWFTGVLAGLLLLVLTLPVLADEALKVGLITPLTGSVSTFGIPYEMLLLWVLNRSMKLVVLTDGPSN